MRTKEKQTQGREKELQHFQVERSGVRVVLVVLAVVLVVGGFSL